MQKNLTASVALALCLMLPVCCLAATPAAAWRAPAGLSPTGRWTGHVDGAAKTPPMGWNSWNAFRTEVDEAKVMGAAHALVDTGLARLGYRYVNLDDGWWQQRRVADGRMQIRTRIFPSAATGGPEATSFRPFTDSLHALGLKAGIYTDIGRNACSQAFDLESPNLPEGSAVEREVGLDGHVQQDIGLYFREWGFDYLKVDACGLADFAPDSALVRAQGYRGLAPEIERSSLQRTNNARVRQRYEAVAAALKAARPAGDYVLSLCSWGMANVRSWGQEVGNLWRTSSDITAGWSSMLHNFDSAARRALYAGPGHWNDPDILYIGWGDFDAAHLTEARSHFSLWAMMSAPLLVSFDLRSAPPPLIELLSNPAIIALDQDPAGNQATLAYDSDDAMILVKTLGADADTRKAVALINRGAAPVELTLTAGHLKFAGDARVTLKDLWSQSETSFAAEQTFKLAPHETRVFRASGQRQLVDGVYLSEIPGSIHVALDGTTRTEADPLVHRMIDPWAGSRSGGSRPVYGGWGGAQADSTPYGQALQINGTTYANGIGVLANSRLEIRNSARLPRFRAAVGIDDSSGNRSRGARFQIHGDGKLLASATAQHAGEPARPISVDVGKVSLIELVALSETGPEELPVVVTWAEARLTR